MIAQAILESGSGESQLAKEPYYNLFGVKGSFKEIVLAFQQKRLIRGANFIQFPLGFAITVAIMTHCKIMFNYSDKGLTEIKIFINQRGVRKPKLPSSNAFLTGKYATDKQYDNKLNSLIAVYNLTQFDLPKQWTV